MSNDNRVDHTTGAGQAHPTDGAAVDEAYKNAETFKKVIDGKDNGAGDMAYYLELQRAMMQEQQAYTALSNVLKARSDACLSAVRNFKQ
jgi:hypothetical protein